jgi:Ca2+-binding EF-hand superfamily protein
MDDEKNQKEGE